MSGRLYSSCVRNSMLHGSETWPVRKENVVALQRAEMRMVRWMCMLVGKEKFSDHDRNFQMQWSLINNKCRGLASSMYLMQMNMQIIFPLTGGLSSGFLNICWCQIGLFHHLPTFWSELNKENISGSKKQAFCMDSNTLLLVRRKGRGISTKGCHTPQAKCWLPSLGLVHRWLTHSQAYGYLLSCITSSPTGRHQVMLLGDKDIRVWTTCPVICSHSNQESNIRLPDCKCYQENAATPCKTRNLHTSSILSC